MNDIERNLPLWLQPAHIFTLHPDNSPLSEGGAQDERRHGTGHDPAIPALGHRDHAAIRYKIWPAPRHDMAATGNNYDHFADFWTYQFQPLKLAAGDIERFNKLRAAERRAYKIAIFNHAARHVALAIAALTAGGMIFCILST